MQNNCMQQLFSTSSLLYVLSAAVPHVVSLGKLPCQIMLNICSKSPKFHSKYFFFRHTAKKIHKYNQILCKEAKYGLDFLEAF